MKSGIHPTWYDDALVVCACGNTWRTGSTKKEIHTDVCSSCHPFYTGEQRIVDTAGQVERFMKRVSAKEQLAPKPEAPVKPTKKERRARARGDMRSGMREVQAGQIEATELPAPAPETLSPEPSAPEIGSVEPQAPEAIMIEPTPAGRVWEAVPVEPVEFTPVVEPSAPVSETSAEAEARTPAAEIVVGEPLETSQAAPIQMDMTAEVPSPAPTAEVIVGEPLETVQAPTTPTEMTAGPGEISAQGAGEAAAPEARAPETGHRPPRARTRQPRASTEGHAETPKKPRQSTRGGARKARPEKPEEPAAEKPAEAGPSGEATGDG